ncbi:hypothetical protein [Salipaludibacillus sp. CF4.18]|uniref:hypothetical protein n=1 Tax=Salipaludibacillus sp. CF4.18 TaxID=3373081 RepID=UPI003EE4BE2F
MTGKHLSLLLFSLILSLSLIGCSQETSKEPLQLSEEEDGYLDVAYFAVYQYDEMVNKFTDPNTRDSLGFEQIFGGVFAIGLLEESLNEEFVPDLFEDTHQNIMDALSDTSEDFTSLTTGLASGTSDLVEDSIKEIQPSNDKMKEVRSELEGIYKDADKAERIEYIQHNAKDSLEMFD